MSKRTYYKFFLLLVLAVVLFMTPVAVTHDGRILIGDPKCAEKALAISQKTGQPVITSCK